MRKAQRDRRTNSRQQVGGLGKLLKIIQLRSKKGDLMEARAASSAGYSKDTQSDTKTSKRLNGDNKEEWQRRLLALGLIS